MRIALRKARWTRVLLLLTAGDVRTSFPYPMALANSSNPLSVSTASLEDPEMITLRGSPLLEKSGGKYPKFLPPPCVGFL